jgi:hypothetical protein
VTDRVRYPIEVLADTPLPDVGIRARSVAADDRRARQQPVVLRYAVQPHQIRLRGVDRDGVADEPGPPRRVVLEEPIEDLPAGLPDADDGELHRRHRRLPDGVGAYGPIAVVAVRFGEGTIRTDTVGSVFNLRVGYVGGSAPTIPGSWPPPSAR